MRNLKRIGALLLSACITISALAGCGKGSEADASKYPAKDVTYLVPYSAGGSSDQMARLMTEYFLKETGKNLVIENVPGAGGNVGLSKFATMKPDGYTIASFNTTANLQPIYGSTNYDYLKIFAPIALCVSIPIAVAVPKDSPFNTIEELIEYAKINPGKLKYGHAGVGSITHVTGELFKQEAGIDMTQVPFGSGNDALTALLGNHIDVDIAALSEVLPQRKEGMLKILAMCTNKQVEDIPTLVSKGYNVDMKVTQGLCTLKKVDEKILQRLDEIFGKVINNKEYQEKLQKLGMEVDYLNAAEFATFLQEQRETFVKVVTSSGILDMVKKAQ